MSCDLLDTEIPGSHYKGDVLDILYQDWDLIIAHPPCTFLCNSGVRWLFDKDRPKAKQRWLDLTYARKFFYTLHGNICCKKIAIENPIPHKHAALPAYTQTIQPYEFGHTTSKRTCLWLKGLPLLKPTEIVPKEKRTQDIWLMPPGPERQRERSRTFKNIALAMADQWG